ncbi:hypothetical protein [Evansella clarkii]|uniref:hypothetical protein n=1 Tax=Evansella clarkii TaxID=79879 RepID=UPI0014750037|nr:hypothetical protein [Evansella clarkii]
MDDGQMHRTVTDGNRQSKRTENKLAVNKNKSNSQRKPAILSLLVLAVVFAILWIVFTI